MNNHKTVGKILFIGLAMVNCSHAAASVGPLTGQDCKAISRLCWELAGNGLPSFSEGRLTNEALINFSVNYNYQEHRERCVLTSTLFSGQGHIAPKYVAQAAKDFFGKPIHNESTDRFNYRLGNYYFFEGDGSDDEPNDWRVRSCVRQSDNTYLVMTDFVNKEGRKWSPESRLVLKRAVHGGATPFIVISYKNYRPERDTMVTFHGRTCDSGSTSKASS